MTHSLFTSSLSIVALAGLMETSALAVPPPAEAAGDPLPAELEGVKITDRRGTEIPRDLSFETSDGKKVRLGDLLDGRPAILTFNYSNCPLLCSVQLGGLTEGLAKLPTPPGEQFQIITISLDPRETPRKAGETKAGYLKRLAAARQVNKFPPAKAIADNWTFLVGDDASIHKLAETVGFGYTYHRQRNEFLHPSTFMMLTPKGIVAQYVHGVHFEREQLEAAIAAASLGALTDSEHEFILSCYFYEKPEGLSGFKIMKIGAGAFAGGVLLALVSLHLVSRRRAREQRA